MADPCPDWFPRIISNVFKRIAVPLPAFVCALSLALALWWNPPLSPHDAARALQLCLMALACLAVAFTEVGVPRPANLVAGASLAGLATLACLRAPSVAVAAQDMTLHIGLLGVVWATAGFHARSTQGQSRAFDRCLAFGPIWLALLTLVIYLAALGAAQPLNARALHGAFDNPRFLNHAQTLFVPWLVLAYAQTEPRRSLRMVAFGAAAFHVALVWLDVARGTMVAWLAAFAWLWIRGHKHLAWRWAAVLGAGVVTGLAVFEGLPHLLGTAWAHPFASMAGVGDSHSRGLLWHQAIDMIVASHGLGAGPMSFAMLPGARGAHPHNIYLQWAAEYGLPAMALAVWLLTQPLRVAARTSDLTPRAAVLAAIVVAALVDAMFSGNFVMPVSQLWIALIFGEWLGCSMREPVTTRPPPSTASTLVGALARVGLLTAIAVLLAFALPQWLDTPPHIPRAGHPMIDPPDPRPRFWLHGQL